MPRFFVNDTEEFGKTAVIRGRDAEHIRVLRLRPGEAMTICDGRGTDYRCRLVRSDKDEAEAEILEVVPCPGEPSVKVRIFCGLPKGDKTDYIIQKCVEAGASEIVFFDSERVIQRTEEIGALEQDIRGSGKAVGQGNYPRCFVDAGLRADAQGSDRVRQCPVHVRDRQA